MNRDFILQYAVHKEQGRGYLSVSQRTASCKADRRARCLAPKIMFGGDRHLYGSHTTHADGSLLAVPETGARVTVCLHSIPNLKQTCCQPSPWSPSMTRKNPDTWMPSQNQQAPRRGDVDCIRKTGDRLINLASFQTRKLITCSLTLTAYCAPSNGRGSQAEALNR